jgi:hypothetical protein
LRTPKEDARDILQRLEEAISNIEREERENFAGLVDEAIERELEKELMPSRKHNQYAYGLARAREIIKDILKELAED